MESVYGWCGLEGVSRCANVDEGDFGFCAVVMDGIGGVRFVGWYIDGWSLVFWGVLCLEGGARISRISCQSLTYRRKKWSVVTVN